MHIHQTKTGPPVKLPPLHVDFFFGSSVHENARKKEADDTGATKPIQIEHQIHPQFTCNP